jgi:hypothetical protein
MPQSPMDENAPEPDRIRQSAAAAFAALPGSDIKFAAGHPERVYSPEGHPAYWLVPGLVGGRIQGIARILEGGRVATVGGLRAAATDCAQAVTGLCASEAFRLTKGLAVQYPDAEISRPLLVSDGPVGREAWLYHVKSAAQDLWIFATGGGVYSRPAGKPLAGG